MIYKIGNIYYGFHIALGSSQDSKQQQMNSKELRFGLYYAVHERVFDSFVTQPLVPTSVHGDVVYTALAPGAALSQLEVFAGLSGSLPPLSNTLCVGWTIVWGHKDQYGILFRSRQNLSRASIERNACVKRRSRHAAPSPVWPSDINAAKKVGIVIKE